MQSSQVNLKSKCKCVCQKFVVKVAERVSHVRLKSTSRMTVNCSGEIKQPRRANGQRKTCSFRLAVKTVCRRVTRKCQVSKRSTKALLFLLVDSSCRGLRYTCCSSRRCRLSPGEERRKSRCLERISTGRSSGHD